MVDRYMLTTLDNPYDPFTQWDEWRQYDTTYGYYTSELLARITRTSDELSDIDQQIAVNEAVDEIVKENVLGLYKKVTQKLETSVGS